MVIHSLTPSSLQSDPVIIGAMTDLQVWEYYPHWHGPVGAAASDESTNRLYVCQPESGPGGAAIFFNRYAAPELGDKFHWELVDLAGNEASAAWEFTSDQNSPFGDDTWFLGGTAPEQREFVLRTWFDCDGNGQYASNEPHRLIDIQVVDVVDLTLSNVLTGVALTSTDRDAAPTNSNTLYLMEATNATATMTINAAWAPANVPSGKFRWAILNLDDTPASEWTSQQGVYGATASAVTWTEVGTAPVRQFKIRTWFDCDQDGNYSSAEPARIAYVTVLKVELEPITIEGGLPPDNSCGIETNRSSEYAVNVDPAVLPDANVIWSKVSGDVEFVGGNNKGRTVTVKGNTTGDFKIEVDINGALSPKPSIKGKVLDKKTVNVFVHIVRKDDGTSAATTEATFSTLLAEANKFYEQVAIEFKQAGSVTYIDKTDWLEVETTADGWAEYKQLQSTNKNTGGIEIYCIDDLVGANGANFSPSTAEAGLTIGDNANSRTLAHELGHACGLADSYVSKGGTSLPDDKVKESWLPDDWSGGSGTGYYNRDLKQKDLIQRLIMYGVGNSTKADFALGKVHGVDRDGNATLIKVGLSDMNRQPQHW